jgi:hypothetical protein
MTKFDWIISAMECKVKEDNLSDVVILVHWRYNAASDEYFADTYGATSVPLPTGEDFTPYAELTKEQVVSWLENTLDVEAMQLQLEANIELQINPINVTLPPPFENNLLSL